MVFRGCLWPRFLASLPPNHDHLRPSAAQHRDHRPRRPRQDDPRRQTARAGGHVRQAPAPHRTGDGQQRSRTGAGHHHPRQELLDPVPRYAHQHRRHPGPCGLRRRGRAGAGDGRRRAAAGRRGGRADAADALRHAQGAPARPAADRRHQQGRPPRRAAGVGRQPDVRAVRPHRRERSAARFPGRLRVGAERVGDHRRRAGQGRRQAGRRRPARAVRNDHRRLCRRRSATPMRRCSSR